MTFTANAWNLTDIIAKTRSTTGRPDMTQLTDQQIVDYINRYYQYVMPKELKIFFEYTYYTFYTIANQDTYNWPVTFATTNPVARVDGFPLDWYTSPDLFYQDYPLQLNKVNVGTYTGTNNFSFSLTYFPVLANTTYVTDGIQVAMDNGQGGFNQVSPVVPGPGPIPAPTPTPIPGSIDYATGIVSGLQFVNTPVMNAQIIASIYTYQAARPQGILYYNNQYILRLVPDQVYEVIMEGLPVLTPLINPTDVPFRTDLGPLIAFGASLEIFSDFNQMDQWDQYQPQYQRYKDIAMQDTYEVYLYQRSVPAF